MKITVVPRAQTTPEQIVARIAADADAGQDELVEQLLERMREATPELFADHAIANEMRLVTEASVARVQRILADPEHTVLATPAATLDFAQVSARFGLPLVSLIEACRMAQVVTSDWWRHRLESEPEDRETIAEAIESTSTRIGQFIDLVVAASREAYATDWEGGLATRRMRLVQRILAEQPVDPEEAARVLNYPLHVTHTAAILWADDPHDQVPAPEDVASELGAALGATRLLTVACTERSVWMWAVTHDDRPRQLEQIADGTFAAVGTPQSGVDGFRRSHLEAAESRRVVLRQGARCRAVTHYRDVEVLAIMSRDEAALRQFLSRTLGPLAEPGDGPERLRATLMAYLAADQQVAAAARRLGVHRNTVSYRLRALEDALGPRLYRRRIDLELALELCDRLGPIS